MSNNTFVGCGTLGVAMIALEIKMLLIGAKPAESQKVRFRGSLGRPGVRSRGARGASKRQWWGRIGSCPLSERRHHGRSSPFSAEQVRPNSAISAIAPAARNWTSAKSASFVTYHPVGIGGSAWNRLSHGPR